jgi:hypothetical protein
LVAGLQIRGGDKTCVDASIDRASTMVACHLVLRDHISSHRRLRVV